MNQSTEAVEVSSFDDIDRQNPSNLHMDASLDRIIGILVLSWPAAFKQIHSSPFASHVNELLELHSEVHFCLWAMNLSLSVYIKLLNLVDIQVRKEISGDISRFLSEWKGARDTQLSDKLDELIISKFRQHALTQIPDMERLQQDKDCHMLSSTVETYIKDIAVKLDSRFNDDVESTIEMIFPSSKDFIGRHFFPRLASVSARLLELIKCKFQQSEDTVSGNDSKDSEMSTNPSSPYFE